MSGTLHHITMRTNYYEKHEIYVVEQIHSKIGNDGINLTFQTCVQILQIKKSHKNIEKLYI